MSASHRLPRRTSSTALMRDVSALLDAANSISLDLDTRGAWNAAESMNVGPAEAMLLAELEGATLVLLSHAERVDGLRRRLRELQQHRVIRRA